MHIDTIEQWTHDHAFLGAKHVERERRTWFVVVLTTIMMAGEIVGGTIYGSMALVADGWHMCTHAGALAIAAFAYRYARRHVQDARFCFGTGKLGDLAGYSSALMLALIALLIGYKSVARLLNPVLIGFDEAILIAGIGLGVNLASAWLLRDEHDHDHHQHDHNLRAAYLHVLADAMTSVLAIAALLAGRLYGWIWMDPTMGVVGALVIAHWSIGLLSSSGAVLLDTVFERSLAEQIKARLETGTDKVADLHVWQVGPGHLAVIATIVTDCPRATDEYKARLRDLGGLSHITIELHACPGLHNGAGGS